MQDAKNIPGCYYYVITMIILDKEMQEIKQQQAGLRQKVGLDEGPTGKCHNTSHCSETVRKIHLEQWRGNKGA